MSGKAADGAQGHTESATQTDTEKAAAAAAASGGKTAEQIAADAAAADAAAKEKGSKEGQQQSQGSEGEKGKGKTGDEAAAGAPEKYSLTIPDDGKTYVDDADITAFEKSAREAGMSNDEAQAAINDHVTQTKLAAANFLAVTKADSEYGGEKLAETQRLAKVAIDLIRPEGHARRESFTKFLNKVGASNHIEVVSFLADLGKRASEDSTGFTSSSAKGAGKTPEQKLYDNTPAT